MNGGGIEPSPTSDRRDSGRKLRRRDEPCVQSIYVVTIGLDSQDERD